MYKKTSRFLTVAAASVALAVGTMGAAYAQTAAPADAQTSAQAQTPGAHNGHHRGHRGHRGAKKGGFRQGGFLQQLKHLHDRLNLNADQEQQWQAALATGKQNHEAARANFKQFQQQFDALKQQPIIDMNALHDAGQRLQQQNEQLHENTTRAWLKVYSNLNDQQKTIVSNDLKARFAKMEQWREKARAHWKKHHGAAASSSAAPDAPDAPDAQQ